MPELRRLTREVDIWQAFAATIGFIITQALSHAPRRRGGRRRVDGPDVWQAVYLGMAYDEEKNEVEIGWTFLARSHWGGRYNGEMKRLMLQHAFRFVGSVLFVVGVENWRSQRAVEKIGGVCVGVSADAGGRESYVYKITARPLPIPAAARRDVTT
jgi:RimJ/RimL family protein N-acetyltransferase